MLINFMRRFALLVACGAKTQTIRARGKRRPPRVGEKLQLYFGLRTQYVKRLLEAECISVDPIGISPAQRTVTMIKGEGDRAYWEELDAEAIDLLARADGFPDADQFFQFFAESGGAFSGYLIRWMPLNAQVTGPSVSEGPVD